MTLDIDVAGVTDGLAALSMLTEAPHKLFQEWAGPSVKPSMEGGGKPQGSSLWERSKAVAYKGLPVLGDISADPGTHVAK